VRSDALSLAAISAEEAVGPILNVAVGGGCSKGRPAAGGTIPDRHLPVETPESDHGTRTRRSERRERADSGQGEGGDGSSASSGSSAATIQVLNVAQRR
jgi:hypothetical protein